MIAVKLAVRNLIRYKSRTAFTILCVILGVTLIGSVGIASESIQFSLKQNLGERFGAMQVLLKPSNEQPDDLFQYNSTYLQILNFNQEVEEFVPRFVHNQKVGFNYSSIMAQRNINLVGINAELPEERKFGRSIVVDAVLGNNFTDMEDLLLIPGNSCVITEYVANTFNLTVGNFLWFAALNKSKLHQNETDLLSWSKFTIQGIITDYGESLQFSLNANDEMIVEYEPLSVYIHFDSLYSYIWNDDFSSYGQDISYLMIEVTDVTSIGEITQNIENQFEDSIFGEWDWHAYNVLEDFDTDIAQTFDSLILIFYTLGLLSMIVCAVLIKTILETHLREINYEFGIFLSIGSSKWMIFKILFYQLIIMASIGTLIGVGTAVISSKLILYSFSNSTTIFNRFDWGTIPVDFHMVISLKSILISSISGIIVPIILGIIPILNIFRKDIDEIIRPKKGSQKLLIPIKKKIWIWLFLLIVSISMIVGGYYSVRYSVHQLFIISYTDVSSYLYLSLGILGMITGLLIIGAVIYPFVSLGLSYIFSPFLRELRHLSWRNTLRNRRQTNNQLAIMVVTITILIFSMTLSNSFLNGGYLSAQMQIGGDLQTEIDIPYNLSAHIESLDHIDTVCPAHREENVSINGYTHMKTDERFVIYAINAEMYWKIVNKLTQNIPYLSKLYNWQEIFIQFSKGDSILMEYPFENFLEKNSGDNVTVTWDTGSSNNFTILAFLLNLPGFLLPDRDICAFILWDDWVDIAYNHFGDDFYTSQKYGVIFFILIDDSKNLDAVIEELKVSIASNGYIITNLEFLTAKDHQLQGEMFLKMIMIVISFILVIGFAVSILGLIFSMLTSVRQRHREIGMMRSTGTHSHQILRLIFGESALIGIVSVVIGFIGGFLINSSMLGSFPVRGFLFSFILIYPINAIIVVFGVMFLVVVIVSILPAITATHIDIVDSLRRRD